MNQAAGATVPFYSYVSFVSVACTSMRWEQQLQQELLRSKQAASLAALFESKSVVEETTAQDLTSQSTVDQSQAVVLQEEAAALQSQAERTAADAAALQAKALEYEDMAVTTQNEAVEHVAAAAVEESVNRDALAASVEEGEAALATELRAHADEAGVALCQFIPGIDVLCDVIGGWTAVGLETAAAVEAGEVAADVAAAGVAHGLAEKEHAKAAQLEGEAAAEQVQAEVAHQQAAALTEQAEAEQVEAQAQEAASEEKMEQSAVEKEEAAAETIQASQDKFMAEESLKHAVGHGVGAVGYALLQVLTAGITMLYFCSRFLTCFLVEVALGLTSSSDFKCNPDTSNSIGNLFARLVFWCWWFLSTVVHSTAILLFTIWIFQARIGFEASTDYNHKEVDVWDSSSIRQRGGVVLEISFVSTILQMILLHQTFNFCCFFRNCCVSPSTAKTRVLSTTSRISFNRYLVRIVTESLLVWGWNIYACVLSIRLLLFHNYFQEWTSWCESHSPYYVSLAAVFLLFLFTLTLHHRFVCLKGATEGRVLDTVVPPAHVVDDVSDSRRILTDDYYDAAFCWKQESDDEAMVQVLGVVSEATSLLSKRQSCDQAAGIRAKAAPLEAENELLVVMRANGTSSKPCSNVTKQRWTHNASSVSIWTRHHQLLLDLLLTIVLVSLLCGTVSRTSILRPFWAPAKQVTIDLLKNNREIVWLACCTTAAFLLSIVVAVVVYRKFCRSTK